MSHMQPLPPRRSEAPSTLWRFFPWYVAAGIGFVMLVNFGMTWLAVRSFPGLATTHAFAESNSYDRVIAAAEHQAALGWRLQTSVAELRPMVQLTGPDGAPLQGARVSAVAERPVGDPATTPLAFRAIGPGRFEASATLPAGRWDIDLTVVAAGAEYHSLRRMVIE